MFGGGDAGGEYIGYLTLSFHEYEVRKRPSAEVIAEIRRDLADLAGAEIEVAKEEEGPPTGGAVTVRLIGEDFKLLEELSREAKNLIANVPGTGEPAQRP